MSEIEQQVGSPEAVEPEPIVVDAKLAARCFWAGVASADKKMTGDEMLTAFVSVITYTYPATEKHAEIQKMGAHFERVMKEMRRV